jgi:prepilin-type N-terminal cleavage/methylation domain-containing protein
MFKSIERVRRDEGGFTLIELLIVIVILGILAGVVLFATGGITDRGTVAACKTDLKNVETAVEAYRAKTGQYPPDLDPTLTNSDGAHATSQFLRPAPGDYDATGMILNHQTGYTINYQGAATGEVDVNGNNPLTTC